ncbi:MAG: hypothetical protein KDN05_21425, partial [Verrucomicrobiae bacterium]|nr:hypothetical protein [Verrucomicrobiae bacterium]
EYKALSLQQHGLVLGDNEPPSVLAKADLSDGQRSEAMATLKEKMVDWVLEAIWNDQEAPKRLHELLKNRSAVNSAYAGQPTVNGRIFRAFAQKVGETWRLPTKKAVRSGAGLGNAAEDETAAARAFGKLGLNGLPGA